MKALALVAGVLNVATSALLIGISSGGTALLSQCSSNAEIDCFRLHWAGPALVGLIAACGTAGSHLRANPFAAAAPKDAVP